MSTVLDVPRRMARVARQRFRQGGRPALAWTLRLTTAAVASYLVGSAIFPRTQPLLAPLTALLVVQLTPVSLLASGIDRVFSVVAGVFVAVAVSTAVHLTWWSLAAVIALSIMVGQALRLGPNLLEVPISAMLVLGVGSMGAESAGGQRIAETLVGAGVGVLSNLFFPPKIAALDAGTALQGLAERLADLLNAAAADMAQPRASRDSGREETTQWLDQARVLTHDLPGVGSALLRAEQGRRLNLRALGTPDAGPGLRQGMEALEHCAVAVRSMFRSFVDASGGEWNTGEHGDALRSADALIMDDLAAGLRAFGLLVRAESQPGEWPAPEMTELQHALERLREARARITELVLSQDDPSRTELNFALMSTVKRVMTELDLDRRLHPDSASHKPRTLPHLPKRAARQRSER